MSETRTRRVEVYRDGALIDEQTVEYTVPTAIVNEETLHDKARQALATNAAYLALATPTNAQNLAQIRALTRETNALIRLMLGLLDDTTGT